MMEVTPRQSDAVTSVSQEGNCFYFHSQRGLTRICPIQDNVIRISCTAQESFPETSCEGEGAGQEGRAVYEQKGTEGVLTTSALKVRIQLSTGSLRFETRDGKALLREREYESRTLEDFDAYRTLEDPQALTEEIQTPDGVKQKVRDAARVFDKRLYRATLHLQFAPSEKLFGLGQAPEGLGNLRHTTQYLHQANLKIPLPVLLSDAGYGVYMRTESPVVFEDTPYGSFLHAEAVPYLDYYLLSGDLKAVVKGMRRLTGKAVMLPEWAFGYIQSKERYENAQDLLETAARFRELGFPMDALVLDWLSWPEGQWGQKSFDPARFPDPAGMIDSLHEQNVRFMISIWPNAAQGCENYKEMKEAGLLLPNSGIYNAFSPEGRKRYWEQMKQGLFRHGVDAWWCDSSEPVTPEWERQYQPPASEQYHRFVEDAEKLMPADQTNVFCLYHARAVYEGQRKETQEKRVVNLTRSGWPGIQQYGTILWSGDIYASWDNLKRQITAGLQFCACGLPYWTLDIGAFFVKKGPQWFWNGEYPEGLSDPGYRELYTRWFQYGAFLPIFRSHGTDVPREPWNFGAPGTVFYDALLQAALLRYRLMPYLYSLAWDVYQNDSLLMRPLVYDFPGDETAAEIWDQYLLGPCLLVCPVTEPMEKEGAKTPAEMTVYLPAGTDWYDFYSEERLPGGGRVQVRLRQDRIPVFVRAGSILPLREPETCTARMRGKEILLQAYPGADGNFDLYEDAGDGYGYEKGEYCVTGIRYRDGDQSLAWETKGDLRYRQGGIRTRIAGNGEAVAPGKTE